jgi:hypothetical protein
MLSGMAKRDRYRIQDTITVKLDGVAGKFWRGRSGVPRLTGEANDYVAGLSGGSSL